MVILASHTLRTCLFEGLCSLLLGHHDLKATKVAEIGTLLLGRELLGPGSSFPLGGNPVLVPSSLKLLLARILSNLRNDVSQSESLKEVYLTVDARDFLRTVDEDLCRKVLGSYNKIQ